MSVTKLLKITKKYRIDDYVMYLGPSLDKRIIMRVEDIIDLTTEVAPYDDYEIALIPIEESGRKKEIWAKETEVRPLKKGEALLLSVLYD